MDDSYLQQIYQWLEKPGFKSLHDVLEARRESMNLSKLQISKILAIERSRLYRQLDDIQNGKLENIDFHILLSLCQLLGVGIEEMAQVYVGSLSAEKIAELEQARKANYILNNFDLKALKDVGFISDTSDFKHIEERILKFFGLEKITDYTSEVGAVLFSRTKKSSHDKMREFWVRSAYFHFERIDNPNPFDSDRLIALLPKIMPYTRYEEKGLKTVLKALYSIGITVIIQSYLPKTQVRGGTFVVKGKPCIVLTDFNENYSTLWFALMHELYHVRFDLEELATWKYHLTGEAQSELTLFKEDYANLFACEMLFPKEKLKFISPMINNHNLVSQYAEENKVHPSIIYNFYCYELSVNQGKNVYGFYQKYFGKADKAIKVMKVNPWLTDSLTESIEKVKKVLTELE